jgi:hypothetical protein
VFGLGTVMRITRRRDVCLATATSVRCVTLPSEKAQLSGHLIHRSSPSHCLCLNIATSGAKSCVTPTDLKLRHCQYETGSQLRTCMVAQLAVHIARTWHSDLVHSLRHTRRSVHFFYVGRLKVRGKIGPLQLCCTERN